MKKYIFVIISITVLSFLYSQDFDFISQFQGICYSGESQGNYAYFTTGGNMHILDISNPDNISIINELYIGKQMCTDIHIDDDLMFLGTAGEIQIYQMNDQTQPLLINQIEHGAGYVNKMLSTDSLLIAILSDYALIYDIGDLENISYQSCINFSSDEEAYCINNNIIYGFYQEGYSGPHYLEGWDISNPENPDLIVYIELGGLETPWPDCFFSYNNLLFSGVNDSIRIYDISIQEEINFITSFGVESNIISMNIVNDVIYISTEDNGIIMINISDIFNPETVGSFAWNTEVTDIFVDGNLIFLSAENEGIKILDASEIMNPVESFAYDETRSAWTLEIQDDIAYIGTFYSGLYTLDVSNLEEHFYLGQVDLPNLTSTELFNSHLYCLPYSDSSLYIVDVNNPSFPEIVGEIITDNNILDFCIQDSLLYLVEVGNGIRVYDLRYPASPPEIAFHETTGYKINVYENYLFLYDSFGNYPGTAKLKLFDIENLDNFQLLSELNLGEATDYSVKKIMLNFSDSPNLILGCRRSVVTVSIHENELQHDNEYILNSNSELFGRFYFDGDFIYCYCAGTNGTSIFNSNLFGEIIHTISGNAINYCEYQDNLFISHSSSGYSMYEISNTNIEDEIIPNSSMQILKLSNHPNPFNPTTTISFELSHEGTKDVKIEIYNIKGQLVESLSFDSIQDDSVIWNASEFSTGIYFYKLNVENSPVKKMVLLK